MVFGLTTLSVGRRCSRLSHSFSHCAPALRGRVVHLPHQLHRNTVLVTRSSFYNYEDNEMESNTEADDYYSILGLGPQATTQEIRRAYRRAMKDWHPDQSGDEYSNEFAIFLNHVYETLIDPDSRAEYDVISGISLTAKNPFRDELYPKEFAFVDEFSCIGCRLCNNICPKTFGMEEEHGRARVMQQGVDSISKIQEAVDSCPVSCIHWVSAPQLTLLEEVMARMERVDAWILMNGGGKGANLNVFFEASLVWEKRHAERMAKQHASRWPWWSANVEPAAWSRMQNASQTAAEYSSDEGFDEEAPPPRTPGQRVGAAQMAAAARKWRDYQRYRRQKAMKLLPNESLKMGETGEALQSM